MKARLLMLLTRRKKLIIALGCALAVLGVIFVQMRKSSSHAKSPPPLTGALSVVAPETVRAGDTISITVNALQATDGISATLLAVGSYGPRAYTSAFSGGVAQFSLPISYTEQSGFVNLIAMSGEAEGESAMRITPDAPVEPLTPLVGARSIIADSRHWSLIAVAPFDRFGNPVADGTPVQVRAMRPDGALEEHDVQVEHLLAWMRLFSGTHAGRTTISVVTSQVHGHDVTLFEVAGWPVPFALYAVPQTLPADGRQLMLLRTDVIKDKYGNAMPDGTLITFVVQTPDGERRSIPAYSIGGIAEAPLQAAGQPGVFEVRAVVYGMESESLQVAFSPGPAVGEFPVAARIDAANRAIIVNAGPILGPLGQYIPDGTSVQFRVTDAAGKREWATSACENGRATLEMRLATLIPGTYTVEAFAGSGQGTVRFSVP